MLKLILTDEWFNKFKMYEKNGIFLLITPRPGDVIGIVQHTYFHKRVAYFHLNQFMKITALCYKIAGLCVEYLKI